MKRKYFISLLLLGLVIAVQGQINVIHIKTGVDLGSKQGFYYSLPTTLILVEVDVLKSSHSAGPYAAFASKYLGLSDISTTDYNDYSIQGARLSGQSIPDPDQLYFVDIQGKLSKENKAVMFSLSELGLATSVDGSVALDKAKNGSAFFINRESDKSDFGYFAESNLFEQIDTIIQKVLVDTVMVKKVHIDRRWIEMASEDKAVEAANKITKIREARYNLLSGYQEIPYSAGTLAYMDKQLEEMENEYLSLFIGTSHTENLHYTFYIKPEAALSSQKIPVFNFSERGGIKPASGAGGEVFSLQVKKLSSFGELQTIMDAREAQVPGKHGFYYRIPVSVQFDLDFSGGLSASALIPVNQYGAVVSLPPEVINVEFHPVSGGVKHMLAE